MESDGRRVSCTEDVVAVGNCKIRQKWMKRWEKAEQTSAKCISGNIKPVRWNWTWRNNIVPGQPESESLG